MWLIGTVVYFSTVFIVNNKLLMYANSLSFLPLLIYFLSNLMVILAFVIVNAVPGDSLYKMFGEFWQNVGIILALLLFFMVVWPLGSFYHFIYESERYEEARKQIKMPKDEQPLSDQQIKEDGRGDQVPRNDLALDLEAYGDDERDRLLR